jgi:uncharacterized repeat protein (TIGR04138 family)
MLDPAIARLLEKDRRYPLEAYVFVFEALAYAQRVLGMGTPSPSEPVVTEGEDEEDEGDTATNCHVTGPELCEAIRQYALDQYGFMARTVLARWGIRGTGDFGEIVFNLIKTGRMRKTPADRREDFDNVYDFATAFRHEFRSAPAE